MTPPTEIVIPKRNIPRLLYRRENFILVRYPVTVSSKRRTTTGFDMKQPLGGLEREAHVYNFHQSKIASHCIFQRVTEMGSHILRILVRGEIGRFAFSKVIENEWTGIAKNYIRPKINYGLYNWPHNRLLGGRGSKRPAAHTQQKLP